MPRIYNLLLILGVATVVKSHHFIKLVVLAGLGLAGLWMVHTLAQDFNRIQHTSGETAGKFFEKRSINQNHPPIGINWEFVLSRDPARCARSFICQLVAEEGNQKNQLNSVQKSILSLTRLSAQKDTWASKQLLEALKYGESVVSPSQCMKMYKLCPYTSQTMTMLLRLFGG